MNDTIYRSDAIETVRKIVPVETAIDATLLDKAEVIVELSALPSAEAEPTVIRSRTLMPTKDFKEWAKRIRETNPNAVVIPCDAEVVPDETVSFEDAMEIRNTILFKEYMRGRRDAVAVQGEWKRVETRTYKGECTNCGFRHIFMDGHDSQYRFCPYCGARMLGEDGEA